MRAVRNNAALEAQFEQFANGLAAVVAVVQGALIDVHADEAVASEVSRSRGELHGILQRFFAVIERMLDAVAQGIGRGQQSISAKRTADGIAA